MAGGELVSQLGVAKGTNLADLGKGSVILVVASDLEEEAPIWWLRVKQAAERGAELIVANPRPTKLERYASQVVRYSYGAEASTILGMVNSLSAKQNFPKETKASKTGQSGEALRKAAESASSAENLVIFYGSEGLGLAGSQALAQACANLLITTGHVRKVNNGLVAVWSRGNDQGAWEVGFRPVSDLAAALKLSDSIYIAGADPAGDDPDLADVLKEAGFVVVQDLFMTETARLADVVLPAQPWTEREGTYTSGERRVQRFYPGVPRGEYKPDYAITASIGKLVGVNLESIPLRIFNRLSSKLPAFSGLSYRQLAEVTEQWPIVGRGDIYYGGTLYANGQGVGMQLALPTQTPPLAWPQLPEAKLPEAGVLGVPVTILYDQGQTIYRTRLLHQRTPEAHLVMNPADAQKFTLTQGSTVRFTLGLRQFRAELRTCADVPEGIALVPRSLGLPLDAPVAIEFVGK